MYQKSQKNSRFECFKITLSREVFCIHKHFMSYKIGLQHSIHYLYRKYGTTIQYSFFCVFPYPTRQYHHTTDSFCVFLYPTRKDNHSIAFFVPSFTQQERTTILYIASFYVFPRPTRQNHHTIDYLCVFPYPTRQNDHTIVSSLAD